MELKLNFSNNSEQTLKIKKNEFCTVFTQNRLPNIFFTGSMKNCRC